MTARQLIIELLKQQKDFIHSGEIHNYIIAAGYRRNTSESVLSKMVARSEVIRQGYHQDVYCKFNPDYVASEGSLRQIANHQHLTLGNHKTARRGECKPRFKKANLADNGVFDEYRGSSWIYDMDKRLREVRL